MRARRRQLLDVFGLLLAILVLTSACSPARELTATTVPASTPTQIPTEAPTQAPSPRPEPSPTDEVSIFVEPPLTDEQIAAIKIYRKPSGEMAKPYLHTMTEAEYQQLDAMLDSYLVDKRITQEQEGYLRTLYEVCFRKGGMERVSQAIEATGLGYSIPGPGILERTDLKSGARFIGPALGFVYGFQYIGEGEGTPPYYRTIVQLEPGDYDPRVSPEKFWIRALGTNPANRNEITQFYLTELSGHMVKVKRLSNAVGSGKALNNWGLGELVAYFGLFPGCPLWIDTTVSGDLANLISPLELALPTNALGTLYSYEEMK